VLSGTWTYRSFRNEPALAGTDAAAALSLIAFEGYLDLDATGSDTFRGGLGTTTGLSLTLGGSLLRPGGPGEAFEMIGLGLPGTATEGWRFEWRFTRAPSFPGAADQVPALLGTVLRTGSLGPGGDRARTASFIAVALRDRSAPAARGRRRNALTEGL
jgi:hypothetical protein